jgi:hypothetical protein
MPKNVKPAPPQQASLSEVWGGRRKRSKVDNGQEQDMSQVEGSSKVIDALEVKRIPALLIRVPCLTSIAAQGLGRLKRKATATVEEDDALEHGLSSPPPPPSENEDGEEEVDSDEEVDDNVKVASKKYVALAVVWTALSGRKSVLKRLCRGRMK